MLCVREASLLRWRAGRHLAWGGRRLPAGHGLGLSRGLVDGLVDRASGDRLLGLGGHAVDAGGRLLAEAVYGGGWERLFQRAEILYEGHDVQAVQGRHYRLGLPIWG